MELTLSIQEIKALLEMIEFAGVDSEFSNLEEHEYILYLKLKRLLG